jgi:hypothetical protein
MRRDQCVLICFSSFPCADQYGFFHSTFRNGGTEEYKLAHDAWKQLMLKDLRLLSFQAGKGVFPTRAGWQGPPATALQPAMPELRRGE